MCEGFAWRRQRGVVGTNHCISLFQALRLRGHGTAKNQRANERENEKRLALFHAYPPPSALATFFLLSAAYT